MSQEPPRNVWYGLDEALELLAALEDARDALIDSGHLAVLIGVEDQIRLLSRRLDFEDPRETAMSTDVLRATEAARRLGIPTKDLLRLVQERRIRYVMVDGIAHIPVDALEEFRARSS